MGADLIPIGVLIPVAIITVLCMLFLAVMCCSASINKGPHPSGGDRRPAGPTQILIWPADNTVRNKNAARGVFHVGQCNTCTCNRQSRPSPSPLIYVTPASRIQGGTLDPSAPPSYEAAIGCENTVAHHHHHSGGWRNDGTVYLEGVAGGSGGVSGECNSDGGGFSGGSDSGCGSSRGGCDSSSGSSGGGGDSGGGSSGGGGM